MKKSIEEIRASKIEKWIDSNRDIIDALIDHPELTKAIESKLLSKGVKRVNEIEHGKGPDVTVKEVFDCAKALDVHPFAILWPGRIKKTDLETVNDFFKGLTVARMKTGIVA
jgi:hypothetical protein